MYDFRADVHLPRLLAIVVVLAVLSIAGGQDQQERRQSSKDTARRGPGQFVVGNNRRPRRAITDAPFVRAGEVRDQVRDNELVLGVVVDGQPRAYPINQLTGPSREIVNDTLGGRAIAATW